MRKRRGEGPHQCGMAQASATFQEEDQLSSEHTGVVCSGVGHLSGGRPVEHRAKDELRQERGGDSGVGVQGGLSHGEGKVMAGPNITDMQVAQHGIRLPAAKELDEVCVNTGVKQSGGSCLPETPGSDGI